VIHPVYVLVVFVLLGFFNGYVCGYLFQLFSPLKKKNQQTWNQGGAAVLLSVIAFPGFSFATFVVVYDLARQLSPGPYYDHVYHYYTTLLSFAFLSSGILALAGAKIGSTVHRSAAASCLPQQNLEPPFLIGMVFHPNRFLRMKPLSKCFLVVGGLVIAGFTIPLLLLWGISRVLKQRTNWWSPSLGRMFLLVTCSIVSYLAINIECYLLMRAAWMGGQQQYDAFGSLFLTVCVEIVFLSQIAVLFGYYQLSIDGSFSWWWQLLSSGSSLSLGFAVASLFFYPNLNPMGVFSPVMYFGTMMWMSVAMFLAGGSIGTFASIWFVQKIVAKARADTLPPSNSASEGKQPLVDVPNVNNPEVP